MRWETLKPLRFSKDSIPIPGTPSPHDISGRDELQNAEPELPLDEELHGFYENDEEFREFCDQVGVEIPEGLEPA
ncbi:MAG: hypothetical protein SV186_02985 [Candidatus Nanohaloarchaea archaeon]|nr:hypothetical protein [Candidatus Nanohaloarchaea archaeon]